MSGGIEEKVMSGCDWVELLVEHPEFAEKCEWEKLGVDDWSALLRKQPQFADKCGKDIWRRFNQIDLDSLLYDQPQLADKCNLEQIWPYDWVRLICHNPQLAEKCDCWKEFDGSNWASLLEAHPEFADKCDWKLLYLEDMVDLLKCLPQYAVHFDMDKLGDVRSDLWDEELCRKFDECWDKLIAAQPQLAKYRKPCPDYPERPPRNPQTVDISGALQL